jgi:hypothetical protein
MIVFYGWALLNKNTSHTKMCPSSKKKSANFFSRHLRLTRFSWTPNDIQPSFYDATRPDFWTRLWKKMCQSIFLLYSPFFFTLLFILFLLLPCPYFLLLSLLFIFLYVSCPFSFLYVSSVTSISYSLHMSRLYYLQFFLYSLSVLLFLMSTLSFLLIYVCPAFLFLFYCLQKKKSVDLVLLYF